MIMRRILRVAVLLALALPSLLPAQEKTKFPIGVGTKTLGTSLLWLATKKGFFEEQGLDVQPVLLRGTPIAVQALVGESIYVAFGSADAMVSAAVGGVDLVSIAGVINGLTQAIVAGKKYKTFKDLRGATVGVQSLASGATTTLKRIFKRTGSNIRPITSCWRSAAAISTSRRSRPGRLPRRFWSCRWFMPPRNRA